MMDTVKVAFSTAGGEGPSARVAPGTTFLDALRDTDIDIEATCGGRGRCRSCRIKVLKGDVPPPTIMDEVQLGHEEVHEGFRLACQTTVIADCDVLVTPPKAEGGHQILSATGDAAPGERVGLDSGVEKRLVTAQAPDDEHNQTSDIEEIRSALGVEVDEDVPSEVLRKVPGALRQEKGVVTVTTFNGQILDIEAGDTTEHKYGMAFDIGTTSLVGSLVDLGSGEQRASVGSINPQAVFGGDLMSRIAFAQFNPKALAKLRARVLGAVNGHIREACAAAGVDPAHIYKLVVVGNTCMHHIFLGIDPTYVGFAPYAPVVREPLVLPARDVLLKAAPNAQVCLLPIVAGFVGADTMAVVIATRIYESDTVRVVVDIGTNGEVVMGSRDKLMACSAPAGPALEGAQIRHGMRGAVGAIEGVTINADVDCQVIGGVPAIGVCGSGLVDAVAKMLDARVLKESGQLRFDGRDDLPDALGARLIEKDGERQFVLAWASQSGNGKDVTLTQQDVRQLQLAKGAIYSGVLMLQKVMGVSLDEISELVLSGAFGNYINKQSAVRIRLLPDLPLEKITYVGNAAALGAQMALLSETERRRATLLARQIEHVSLGARDDFQDLFVDAMRFTADAGAAPQRKGRRP